MFRIVLPLLAVSLPLAPLDAADFAIGKVGAADAEGHVPVELILLNSGSTEASESVPERLRAGEAVLVRAPDQPAEVLVPAGGFARLRYVADRPVAMANVATPAEVADANPAASAPQPPSADGDKGNAFLGNLSAYEPVYAVYGPGTDSDARLQISFKYQLFGRGGDVGPGAPFLNGLNFAYTQRMFWDLGRQSSPFRNVDYMPELFYLVPAHDMGGFTLGGQAGFRHESNGRAGALSRSLNTVYLQPAATFGVGGDKLTLAPRLWLFAGRRSDNPDVRRYRGNAGLFAEFGRDDGFRISATGRFNPSSGKGAVDALASYPLDRLLGGGPKLYLVAQGFRGYGETLLDYNRLTTRLRIGIGIVR